MSAGAKKNAIREAMKEKEQRRLEQREENEKKRKEKKEKIEASQAAGRMGDVDFQEMVEEHKLTKDDMQAHVVQGQVKINVCVRKRPIFKKELLAKEIECVSVANPRIVVHECNYRVDGITKYVEDSKFAFDNVRM